MSLVVRLLVTVAILALIASSIDLRELVEVLATLQAGYFFIAVVMQLCSSALAAVRWHMLMDNLQFGLGMGFCLRSYFKGMFFNQGLPTSIGGDAIRMLDVAGQGFRKRDGLYAVALDRIVGLFSLLIVPIVFGLWTSAVLPRSLFVFVLLLGVGGLSGFMCALYLGRWTWLSRHPRLGVAAILSERLQLAFRHQRVRIAVASVSVHILASVCMFTIGMALGIELGVLPYLVLVPLALLFSVLPVSLAGWGVREGAMVALFSAIGADKAAVLAMSLLYGAVLMLVSVPGLLVYLRERRRQ